MLNFSALNNLSIMNTMYKHKKKRLVTWVSTSGAVQNQIDYILVPTTQKGLVKNCRVFNSADIYSDHSLLMARYVLLKPPLKKYHKPPRRYDVSKLKDREIAESFKIKIGGSFEALIDREEEVSLDEQYNKFVEVVNSATEETVGFRNHNSVDGL